MTTQLEQLGPAELILQTLLNFSDLHLHHGRPGLVTVDPKNALGVSWAPVTHKVEGEKTNVYLIHKKKSRTLAGVLQPTTQQVLSGGRNVGSYRKGGIFSEAAVWVYKQIVTVWQLDNEFAARWASYAFGQDHRDLKMALAAFMLVQSRSGAPVLENGEVLFHDEDYRDVGEAMMLIQAKNGLDAKYLLRIHDFLSLPGIAEINRDLGFGRSTRRPFLGRWTKVVEKWLAYREQNPKLLEGLVKAGYRTTVMDLARRVGYKPKTPAFFRLLRWKQVQADDGRRVLEIGVEVAAAESWEKLSEEAICRKIVKEKPSWKRIGGLLGTLSPTRAMLAAAFDANVLSDKDIVILTPTLEEMNLMNVQTIRERHEQALRAMTDLRMLNIAKNVRSTELKEKMQVAADKVVQKEVEKVTRGMRIYFFVDISSSMTTAIDTAKRYLAQFLQGFPLDRIHVATFNTQGRVVTIKHQSAKGVEEAFRGIIASGGTTHAAGIKALEKFKPAPDEDSLFVFVGDEGEHSTFDAMVLASGLRPTAFGLIQVSYGGSIIRDTATKLGIPCFMLDEKIFADPYALTRTLGTLIASTPVGRQVPNRVVEIRKSLVETVLETSLLSKPAWAA